MIAFNPMEQGLMDLVSCIAAFVAVIALGSLGINGKCREVLTVTTPLAASGFCVTFVVILASQIPVLHGMLVGPLTEMARFCVICVGGFAVTEILVRRRRPMIVLLAHTIAVALVFAVVRAQMPRDTFLSNVILNAEMFIGMLVLLTCALLMSTAPGLVRWLVTRPIVAEALWNARGPRGKSGHGAVIDPQESLTGRSAVEERGATH